MAPIAAPVELGFREYGAGTPVVLLHAFPLHAEMWQEVADGLSDRAYVLVPDLRGFGTTPATPEAEPSVAAMAGDVRALLDHLHLDRVVLAGLSMGGYVALELAAQEPSRLRALALVDTKATTDTPEARDNRLRMAEAVSGPAGLRALEPMLATLLGDTTRHQHRSVVDHVRGLMADADHQGVAWAQRAMAARRDTTKVLSSLDVDVTVVVGEEDVVTPVADAEQMRRAARRGHLVRIPDAGHLTALEAPDAVTAAIAPLLRR